MKTLIKTAVITVALTSTALNASGSHDGGHGHSHTQAVVSKSDIETTAKQELVRLVQNQKIDKSWSNIPIAGMKKKQFHHNTEWVVSFENSQIKDREKQTLYIFVSLYGKTTGANYTGE